MEDEFDLEQIDREMRLERIRQSSSKLTWDGFSQALKRNLMEKKIVFDADSRIDVIQAIRYLRKHIPVDVNADLMEQLKQLSDSLECTFTHDNNLVVIKNAELHIEILTEQKLIIQCMVGFFGRPLVDSPEALELLNRNDYESLRDAIDSILNVVPTSNNSSDRLTYVSSLESVETWLSQQNPHQSFDRLNTSPYGYFVKRDSLRPSRIYYFVDAHYENATSRKGFDYKLDQNLPYLELSIVAHDSEIEQPLGSIHDPWNMKRRLPVCYCLRFSIPMMISESIWYQLHKYLARYSVVRQHVNAFVYTSEFDFKSNELVLRTNFSSDVAQHRYSMSLDGLKEEKDVVIGELYVENIKNLDKILSLLRTQQVHNTLWESVLCVSKTTWKGGDTVKMKLWAIPGRFELQLYSNECLHLVKIEQDKESSKWTASLSTSGGRTVSPFIDQELTSILHKTHSIPCIMVKAISTIGAIPTPDPTAVTVDDSDLVSSFVDKVGDSWLPRLKPVVPDIEPVVSVSEEGSPMGFLASFKEVEDILVPIPTRPEALPRAARFSSEPYANAFSDLEAICQIADSWDGDGKATTPSAKFDSSPAPRPGGPLPPGLAQLSPLENARLRMAHSVSVASSGMPSTPDIFDFPDDRSAGSGSSYPSPSPHTNPFSFAGSPNARGAATKRRARRKAANVGDRNGSTDSNAPEPIKKPRMSNKPSMMASLRGRASRGSRKSSGLPMPELDRPQLQRSFSDFTATNSFPPTPTHVDSPIPETDSDDEACDPPPLPKNFASIFAQAQAAPPAQPPPAPHTTQTALSSLLATTTAAATSSDPDKPRIQPSRKTSFELFVGQKKSSSSILHPPPPVLKKPISLVSDIYDDGLDSPPLPGPSSSFPVLTPAVQGPSIPIPAAMAAVLNQTTVKVEPPAINSPKVEPPPDIKPEKIDTSKLVLKISTKQRSSPSVDHQKNKIPIIPPTSMGEKVKTEKEKEKGERRKKESRQREDKKERAERTREESRNKKRKGDTKNERDHKRHKTDPTPPPKIDSLSSLPFLQQTTLNKTFKIPKREDKDNTPKDPVTPTTPFTPTLTSPSFSSGGSSGHTLPPMNKPNIKKNPAPSSAQIRLNLPPVQPATYLPKKSSSDSSRRSSGGSSSSYMPISSIPLPKGPVPDRFPERSSYSSSSRWGSSNSNRPSQSSSYSQPSSYSHSSVHSQPPPRSPSPDAVQIDDTNSPEDSLRIAEE